jgi:hypothetical protein
MLHCLRVAVAALSVLAWAGSASASERHFAFTYESAVLHPGGRELEAWNTFRLGKSDPYRRLDTRLEVEVGLTDRLQTALYLNLSATHQDAPLGPSGSSEIEGLSSEWKLKLADPVADPVGLALYGEASAGPSQLGIEGKLIADKRVGRLLGAFNLVAEQEWELGGSETKRESSFEVDAGACWFLTPALTAGLELRSHTVVPGNGEATRSALFLGPTLAYAHEGFWVAVSVLPQIRALAGASDGHLDLEEHERVEVRLLFGLDF